MRIERENILTIGRSTIATEARALATIEANLDERFAEAVECIYNCRGRLIVSGMGKSGHVARKIAATLTSTGTRAIFLHAAEALHGDLGIIAPEMQAIEPAIEANNSERVSFSKYGLIII